MPPKVNLDECDGVGACVDACPMDVFDLIDNKAVATRSEDCTECGICVEVCPTEAIMLI